LSCSRSFSRYLRAGRIILLAGSLLPLACAPEPTTPADTDLSGVWKSDAHLFALSQLTLTLTQESAGIVSGTWLAKRDGCDAPCDTGRVIGRNTILQVELALLGSGRFEGTLVEPSRLRGIFALETGYDTITFVK
jgi:hypothetical protein